MRPKFQPRNVWIEIRVSPPRRAPFQHRYEIRHKKRHPRLIERRERRGRGRSNLWPPKARSTSRSRSATGHGHHARTRLEVLARSVGWEMGQLLERTVANEWICGAKPARGLGSQCRLQLFVGFVRQLFELALVAGRLACLLALVMKIMSEWVLESGPGWVTVRLHGLCVSLWSWMIWWRVIGWTGFNYSWGLLFSDDESMMIILWVWSTW